MKNKSRSILSIFIGVFLCFGFNSISFANNIVAYGITESYKDATLSPTVSGIITTIVKKEGEFVKKGQVILILENELETLEVSRKKLVADSKLEVEAAKSQMETIQTDLEATRQKKKKTKSVSKEEQKKKELEFKLAQAEIERLEVKEKLELIEYNIARSRLNKRIIKAPFDGVIIKHYLEIGENCNPQTPLVRIADVRQCRLITQIDGAVSSNLKKGARVSIKIETGTKPAIFNGTIEFISPVVDPSSGLREVKAIFQNTGEKVKPGVTGSISLK